MKEDILRLKTLQDIDLEINGLDAKLKAAVAELQRRQQVIGDHQAMISALEEKLTVLNQRRRELETATEEDLARIRDRQHKLMNIQTNREYQSLLKETEDAKRANKEREDELMRVLEEIEAHTGKVEECRNLCAGEEGLLAEENEKADQQAAQVASEREKIMKKRAARAKEVAAAILKKYDMLRERRNGVALVEVEGGVCRGCFMNIPPQLFNDLLKEDKLLVCPTCNRIMYVSG